jgi:hypothetical protein
MHADRRTEALLEPVAQEVVANRDDENPLDGERRRHRPAQVAHAPTTPGDDNERRLAGNPESFARLSGLDRRKERGCNQRTHPPRAAGPGNPLDLFQTTLVHDEMKVDTTMRPIDKAGQISDRGAHRNRHAAATARMAEDRCHRRISGNDEIRLVGGDQPPKRSRAE